MDDTAKYVIHADITADGVVERSDVVGAVFGQTEGLLGDDLDLRDLQQSSKLGRIDVDVDSQNGQSFGTVTIASSLDKVETSILAAALETISRVGPCRASVSVATIEDVRAAKRRTVVDRAKELLSESFDEDVMTSREILEEVRQSVRVEDIVEYEGVPAGPRVEDSDAIVVVEGRSDVLNLLRYGVKNAIAVEGTNVPDAVAELTQNRTVTAFLDSDRGGDLIRKELAQVGDIDYVAFAPSGKSVEDLSRHEVMSALRSKRPFDESKVDDDSGGGSDPESSDEPSDESESTPAASAPRDADTGTLDAAADADAASAGADAGSEESVGPAATDGSAHPAPETEERAGSAGTTTPDSGPEMPESGAVTLDSEPATLRGHIEDVIDAETGTARLLDASFATLAEAAAENAFDAVESADEAPYAVIVDGTLEQRLLDVAAQRGVGQIVAADRGEFVKQPADVRIRTADQF